MKQTPEQLKGQHGGQPDTVKIKADNEQGYAVINESDFDADKHEKFAEPKAAAKKTSKE